MAEKYPNRNKSQGSSKPSRFVKQHSNGLLDTFEVILPTKPDYRSCRLKLPTNFYLLCYCKNLERNHSEVLRITELPDTVLDLKQLISDTLSIPIICQLELVVNDILLFDDQKFAEEVPFREGDQMKLTYFGRCGDKMEQLVQQGECISKFCSDYELVNRYFRCDSNPNLLFGEAKGKKSKTKILFKKLKSKITRKRSNGSVGSPSGPVTPPPANTDDMMRDASNVRWALANMYSDVLLPWRDEETLCQRLYMVQEELVDRIIVVWKWARENDDLNLQRVCMLSLWDYGENIAERMYLFERGVHSEVLDVFLDPEIDDDTKYAAIGLIAGFGEFPLGQSIIGVNDAFLNAVAVYLRDTKSSFIETVIGGLLLSLASYHSVPKHMDNVKVLNIIHPVIDSLDFSSVDDFELTYTLVLLFMYLLKSPDYSLSRQYTHGMFVDYFTDFSQNVGDDLIAESEQEKQTSWASMVPFIDLFFVSRGSIVKETNDNVNLLSSYLSCAKTLFSAMMLQEENKDLFIKEDLYGYLICLSWYYKNNKNIYEFLLEVLKRFTPIPYIIPSLYHIATAIHAFNTKGLGAAIEVSYQK